MRFSNKDKVQKKFGTMWQWSDNYNHSPRGRIWLPWKNYMLNVEIIFASNQILYSLIIDKNTRKNLISLQYMVCIILKP